MNQHSEQLNLSDDAARDARAGRPVEKRIYGLFPTRVRGLDSSGEQFHARTLLDNFGADEFDLRLSNRIEIGAQLLVVADIHEATVALHCNVVRADEQPDGAHRLTVSVTHHRFL